MNYNLDGIMKEKYNKADKGKSIKGTAKNQIDIPATLNEESGKTVVFGWGRMSPITTGHEILVNKINSIAKSKSGEAVIYLSQSYDPKKNPLPYDTKVKYAQKAFGSVIQKSKAKTIIQALKELEKKYDNLVLVVGGDRVDDFKKLLNKYNGKDYSFDSIDIVSAGSRADPDSDEAKTMSASAMSASVMRRLASENNFDEFVKGLPKKLKSSAKDVFKSVRDGMKLQESLDMHEKVLNIAQRRAIGMRMKKNKAKIQRGQKIARNKMPDMEKLKKIAMRQAKNAVRDKFTKNQAYSQLMPAQKMMVDKQVAKKGALVQKMAKKLLPATKKGAKEKLKSYRANKSKNESVDHQFEMMFESIDDQFEMMFEKVDTLPSHKHKRIHDSYDYIDDIFEMVGSDTMNENPDMFGLKKLNSITLGKKKYKFAKDMVMKRVEQNKKDGKTGGDINYSSVAADVARMVSGIDARILYKEIEKDLPKSKSNKVQFMPSGLKEVSEEVSQSQINDLEKFADRLLDKFDVDVEFSRHFVDRMNDMRNNPDISISELQKLFKKIAKKKAVNIKKNAGSEAVLKDIQSDLNLPIVIKFNKNDGEFEIVNKTIMRKKDFKTPDTVIKY